ncbi:MAG: pyrroline-5-carboxylate reductase [Clostridia bacterium]|nr:pyrroline-5-carboxylate reductase [Clostridia bacterium]
MKKRIAFLGCGNMASAIIGGILKANIVCDEDINVFDVNKTQYEKFKDTKINTFDTAADAVSGADYIVLAVKPQNYADLLCELSKTAGDVSSKTFISIAAGVSTSSICARFGKDLKVVRTMPNTPLLYSSGTTALCKNKFVSDEDYAFVRGIFAASGTVFDLEEEKMNAIISVTSSSPAYVYLFIKSIIEGAKEQGFDEAKIKDAVCDMVIGSAKMLKQSPKTPDELINMVTSPKGTTERAMNVLYEAKPIETMKRAMEECTKRADELSKLV